jgi:hypothetical protein
MMSLLSWYEVVYGGNFMTIIHKWIEPVKMIARDAHKRARNGEFGIRSMAQA